MMLFSVLGPCSSTAAATAPAPAARDASAFHTGIQSWWVYCVGLIMIGSRYAPPTCLKSRRYTRTPIAMTSAQRHVTFILHATPQSAAAAIPSSAGLLHDYSLSDSSLAITFPTFL